LARDALPVVSAANKRGSDSPNSPAPAASSRLRREQSLAASRFTTRNIGILLKPPKLSAAAYWFNLRRFIHLVIHFFPGRQILLQVF
jgi:hypothetical protein